MLHGEAVGLVRPIASLSGVAFKFSSNGGFVATDDSSYFTIADCGFL